VKPARWGAKAMGVLAGLGAMAIALSLPYSWGGSWSLSRMSSGTLGMLLTNWLRAGVGTVGALTALLLLCAVCGLLVAGAPTMSLFAALREAALRWVGAAQPRKPLPKRVLATSAAGTDAVLPVEAPQDYEEPILEDEPRAETPHEPLVITRAAAVDAPPAEEADEQLDLNGWGGESEGEEPEGEYQLPPMDLLDTFDDQMIEEDEEEIRQKSAILERTLSEFKVFANVVRVQRGPVITMYELALAAGTKVSRVESLADDLAIALKAPNVRIVAPIPGKSTVGIELPNTEREIVGLREMIDPADRKIAKMAIPLFLGKDTAGSRLIVDLAQAPHLLLAGATGSGKSVCVNSIICSILMTRTPHEVQLLLVDPKSVEFSDYARLPHLICPILTDMKKAAAVVQWACKKMDDRYSVLSRVGVRDIHAYNKLGKEEIVRRLDPEEDAEIDDVPFYMPHIVIVIDELAELMMIAAKEVEGSIIRLSQKARAVGIHLICATQRPSVDVITGLIKANLPARIAFNVSSKVDSRTILDRNGAEVLMGRGDLLMLPPGSSRLVRAQGTYMSEDEVRRIVDFLSEQGGPQFKAELREYHAAVGTDSGSDDLYDQAVHIVLETQRGSVSLLQRMLSIGYSRAARLVDMMAEAGIVGSYKGSQAREVMFTLDQWEQTHQTVQ
jgi:S-DNA-T family DNA segregation ATPase FtsK/SpoIIIE